MRHDSTPILITAVKASTEDPMPETAPYRLLEPNIGDRLLRLQREEPRAGDLTSFSRVLLLLGHPMLLAIEILEARHFRTRKYLRIAAT